MGKYCYSSIKEAGGIVSYSNADAKTDHLPKRVRGSGGVKIKINNAIDVIGNEISTRNEIAQYRRYRNHKNISKQNRGGKFLPDFVIEQSPEDIEIMRKYNIPILEIDREVYSQLEKQKKDTKNRKKLEQKEER